MRALRIALLVMPATLLCGGCAGLLTWDPPPNRQVYNAPEVEPTPERAVGASDHLVRKGDTVYSIAFRNNLDFRELARWNSIGTDYLIRPGQVLRLRAPEPVRLIEGDIVSTPTPLESPIGGAPVALNSGIPSSTAPPPGTKGASRPRPIALPADLPAAPLPGTGGSPTPAAPIGSPAPAVVGGQVAIGAPPDRPPPITSESGGPYRWQWPTEGVVVRGFNPATGSKGLDFGGDLGQAVLAAAPGKVVYSGAALKGYGELIIIKHDDLRLSAYGYNRRRLVAEGQMVRGGQQIGELGLGPESRPILHFEIRERGQPVDPVPYLPAKTATR